MGSAISEEEAQGLTAAGPLEDAPSDYGAASPPRGARGVAVAGTAEAGGGPAAAALGEDAEGPGPATAAAAAPEEPVNAEEVAVAALTRRLRCLFHAVTCPIVPLGTLVVLSLLWMLYAAFVQEVRSACAHPLHWYAGTSLLLLVYTPYHGTVRSRLFGYRRDRDGPARPAPVRRCDQVFHTVALLYVYAGITLVQTCREDVPPGEGGGPTAASVGTNTCAATCPGLFRAVSVYVVSLEAFTLSLVLPLLFLPCLYLWLLRQATVDGEALALLQERLREEELLFRGGSATADEVLAQLERVVLVRDPQRADHVQVVSADATDLADAKDLHGASECCICMNDFSIRPAVDLESGNATAQQPAEDDDENEAIVRTHCGHIMHRHCMTSWVDGRWRSSNRTGDHGDGTHDRRARRTTCPLCRRDLRS